MLDVNFRSVPKELLGIREHMPADGVAAFFTPKTPVLLIAAKFDRVLC